jgi:hypothetical protein
LAALAFTRTPPRLFAGSPEIVPRIDAPDAIAIRTPSWRWLSPRMTSFIAEAPVGACALTLNRPPFRCSKRNPPLPSVRVDWLPENAFESPSSSSVTAAPAIGVRPSEPTTLPEIAPPVPSERSTDLNRPSASVVVAVFDAAAPPMRAKAPPSAPPVLPPVCQLTDAFGTGMPCVFETRPEMDPPRRSDTTTPSFVSASATSTPDVSPLR